MSQRHQIILSAVIACVSAAVCLVARQYIYPGPGDFLHPLRLATDLVAGRDPYAHAVTVLSLAYPLPAAVFGLPLLWLPPQLAAAIFFGFSSGLLAFGLLRSGPPWRLLMFVSPLYIHSLFFAQWPPLITAMAFFPALLMMLLVKPQMALAMVLSGHARITPHGVLLTAGILVASLVVMPSWPLRWISLMQGYEGMIPLTVWVAGGPLVLLSLLRRRDKSARLLFFLALMPQRMFYDQLPLFLIPSSRRATGFLLAASWLGVFAWLYIGVAWPHAVVASLYLPCLWMVLRPVDRQRIELPAENSLASSR